MLKIKSINVPLKINICLRNKLLKKNYQASCEYCVDCWCESLGYWNKWSVWQTLMWYWIWRHDTQNENMSACAMVCFVTSTIYDFKDITYWLKFQYLMSYISASFAFLNFQHCIHCRTLWSKGLIFSTVLRFTNILVSITLSCGSGSHGNECPSC